MTALVKVVNDRLVITYPPFTADDWWTPERIRQAEEMQATANQPQDDWHGRQDYGTGREDE